MGEPIIQFDYEASPYGQKTKLLLAAAGVPFKKCDQPAVLPRKDLEQLGITYRRIPVLAVGKDVYCDSSLIIDVILQKSSKVPTGIADKAWEAWGNDTFFSVLPTIQAEKLSPAFVKDRVTIFPMLARPDFKTLRASAVAEFHSRCSYLENVALKKSDYIGGNELSMADIHVIWPIRWALFGLGMKDEPGTGKDAFPKVWKLIESLPEAKPETMSSDEALSAVTGASFSAPELGIAKNDPLGISSGTAVTIESMDAEPGKHPQAGKLVGTSANEVVLELQHGIRIHFPREGYVVRKSEEARL